MNHSELKDALILASRLAQGRDSRVVMLIEGNHYEIKSVTPVADTLVIAAGDEAEAPHDYVQEEADKVDAVMDRFEDHDFERDKPEHLRIAEDQPEQPS